MARYPVEKSRARAMLAFFLFALTMTLVLLALQTVMSRLPQTATLLRQAQEGTLTAPFVLLSDGIGLLVLGLVSALSAKLGSSPFAALGLPPRQAFGTRYCQGLLCGLVLSSAVVCMTWATGGVLLDGLALHGTGIVRFGLVWGVAYILVGLYEEFLFRGYALFSLSCGIGFWPAAIVLSVFFGIVHLPNSGENIFGILNVVFYALFACFTLRRTGNLWFAAGLHTAWNYSLSFLYSVPGSGVSIDGHLLQSHLRGPTWLTGGSAGPEGSAIGFGALLVSFLIFQHLCSPRRPTTSAQENPAAEL